MCRLHICGNREVYTLAGPGGRKALLLHLCVVRLTSHGEWLMSVISRLGEMTDELQEL